MVRSLLFAVSAALLSALASADAPTCGIGKNCPADSPCCSQYGQCGVGAYCLGGCDPEFSHSLDSCVAAPVCENKNYKFTSLDGIQANTIYLGDASKADWVSEGKPIAYDNSVMLTMAPDTVGTLLATTHYVWYGKVSAKMKSSAGKGVVSAFILMSDVKDEIDFEWVGADLQHVQSNYYWQGVLDYHNSGNLSASNTNTDMHEYAVDWTPDSITWYVDGQSQRTVKKSDTWNATSNHYDFPQTPARVMLSLWPAGSEKNGKGTIDWAGGLIDWNSPDMTNGFYHSQVYEVDIQCYDPPRGANVTGSKSYKYTSTVGTNNTVSIVDELGILSSFYATGENPGTNPNASKSASGTQPSQTANSEPNVQTVPGLSGTGSHADDSANNQQQAASSGGSGSTSGLPGGSAGGTNGQFIQGVSSTSGNSGSGGSAAGKTNDAGAVNPERAMKGSVGAVVVALAALCYL